MLPTVIPCQRSRTGSFFACLAASALFGSIAPAFAASYFADFNSPDKVPPPAVLLADASLQAKGGVDGTGFLQLTPAEPRKTGTLVISDLEAGKPVNSFIWASRVRVHGGRGAEGFSLALAPNITDPFGVGGQKKGISICFDTYIYSRGMMQSPAVRLLWDDRTVKSWNYPEIRTGDNFVPVVVKLDADKVLNIFYGSTHLVENFKVEDFQPLAGGKFGIGANCVLATDEHCIDGLLYITGTAEQPLPALDVQAIAALLSSRSKDGGSVRVEDRLLVSGGSVLKSIIYRPPAEGPHPTILFAPRQNTAPASVLPLPPDPENPFPQLGQFFVRHGYVLCVVSLPSEEDEESRPKASEASLPEIERQSQLLQGAVTALKAQSIVDENRIVLMGDGLSALGSLFATATDCPARAAVLFTPEASRWVTDSTWQERVKEKIAATQKPLLLLQPLNVPGMSLFSAARQTLEPKDNGSVVEVFPPFGKKMDEAVNFAVIGTEEWKDVVVPFLERALKK